MEHIIEIENLNKSFGNIHAVNSLSFHVNKGELFAFLGVNGAGKSTTISMICGQLQKDSGNISICGKKLEHNFTEISKKIGVVFQNSALDNQLTVLDNLTSRAALYGIFGKQFKERLQELTTLLDLGSFLNRPLGKLSGGQKRRIDIARALLHNPEILILDEPTTGLDPQTRKMIWNIIHQLRIEKQLTVFLTTHYMEEAADADYIVILDHGKIAAEGTPLQLKNQYAGDYITLYGVEEASVSSLGLTYTKIRDIEYRIQVANTKEATNLIMNHADLFQDYEVTKGKMDDVFLTVTGMQLNGGAEK